LVALECLLLDCTGSELSVVGYNLELGITKALPVVIEQPGKLILNARLFADIINKMPDTELTISSDDKLLTIIKGGGAQFTIMGMSAEEYPEIPPVSEERSFTIEAELLRGMIAQTLYAVSQDPATPVLTGTLFEVKDGILYLVSVDGCRLALRREPIAANGEFKFVVPGKTLSELLKLTTRFGSEEDAVITVCIGNKHIIFRCMGYRIISRLLEGEFIDYMAAIPKEAKTKITVSVRELMSSINRASIIVNEKIKNPIKALFEENQVSISCETALGKVNDIVPITLSGERVRIGFNNKYMADALKASEQDELLMEINSAFSPIKLLPLEGEDFIFLVMPMRLKDD
jgi:DNA polymerase-3 subunit beta